MLNKILLSLALISFIAALIYAPKLLRVYKMINLYEQDKIAFNFINMDKVFQIGPAIPASGEPFIFNKKEFNLPQTYYFDDKDRNLMDALDSMVEGKKISQVSTKAIGCTIKYVDN